MDIFQNNKLYPDSDISILKHYSNNFNLVFIGFLPFEMLENINTESYWNKIEVSQDEAQKENEVFNNLSGSNCSIYSSNENYPDDKLVYKHGKTIKWEEVISKTTLKSYSEINRSLKTSIGAYNKAFQRPDLVEALDNYTKKNKIWHPDEGMFDVFTKKHIYQTFKSLKKVKIIVINEYYSEKKELDLNKMSEFEFIEKIDIKDYYIYSEDKSLLFSIDWDDFFYFIATDNTIMRSIIDFEKFEGRLIKDGETIEWDWKEGEIDNILTKDKLENSWWRKLFGIK